ncbi:MAG: tyrosine-type recombinase/integrase [Kineosporiaceae bacterium]
MVRKRHFGRVRQLPSGRWQARYTVGDGIDRPAPQTFARRRDADEWLARTQAELLSGGWISPEAGAVKLSDYAERWVTERPGLRPRTTDLYRGLLGRHVLPTLGDRELSSITLPVVRQWRAERIAAGVGPVTVAKTYRLLKAVFNTAVDDDLIRRNPCRIPGAGTETSPERPTASVAQVFAIADAIEPRFRVLVLLATFTGIRWGEAMALRRRHLDVERAMVRVESTVSEVRGALVVGPPKTAAGVRSIAVPEALMPDVRAHLAKYAERGADGRVFTGAKGATIRRSNWHTVWRRATEAAGVPELHFHDLRHTGNTLAAGTGASLRDLMTRMGHASARAALIYQHASSERDRAIAGALNELLTSRPEAGSGHTIGHVAGTRTTIEAPGERAGFGDVPSDLA